MYQALLERGHWRMCVRRAKKGGADRSRLLGFGDEATMQGMKQEVRVWGLEHLDIISADIEARVRPT